MNDQGTNPFIEGLSIVVLLFICRAWSRAVARKLIVATTDSRARITRRLLGAMAWRVPVLTCFALPVALFLLVNRSPTMAANVFAFGVVSYPLLMASLWQIARRVSAGAHRAARDLSRPPARPFILDGLKHARFVPTVIEGIFGGALLLYAVAIPLSLLAHIWSRAAQRSNSPAATASPTIAAEQSWTLPVRIGETRESVCAVLGDPSLNWTEYEAKHFPTTASTHPKEQSVLWWQQRGLAITFVAGRVNKIEVSGKSGYSKKSELDFEPYEGTIFRGVTIHDRFAVLKEKLGPSTDSDSSILGGLIVSHDPQSHTWEIPPFLISIDTREKNADENGVHWDKGEIYGSVVIADLRPLLEIKAGYEREQKLVAVTGQSLTPKEIYRRFAHRVVEVDALNSRGEIAMLGTGIIWRDELLATNRHVIAQARSIKVKRYGREEDFAIALNNKDQDWAILGPTGTNTDSLPVPALEIAKTLPDVGDEVTVIGNPEGLTNSLSTGIVAGIRKTSEGTWIQITAPISKGSSGSPVFDHAGRLIGLATLILVDGQNLNFATAFPQIEDGIKQTVEKNKGRKPADIFLDHDQRMPLDSYDNEKMRGSGVDSNRIVNAASANEVVSRLDAKLNEYPDPEDQDILFDEACLRLTYLNEFETLIRIHHKKMEQLGVDYGDWWGIGIAYGAMKREAEMKSAYSKAVDLIEKEKSRSGIETEGMVEALASINRALGQYVEAHRILVSYVEKHPKSRKSLEISFGKSLLERPAELQLASEQAEAALFTFLKARGLLNATFDEIKAAGVPYWPRWPALAVRLTDPKDREELGRLLSPFKVYLPPVPVVRAATAVTPRPIPRTTPPGIDAALVRNQEDIYNLLRSNGLFEIEKQLRSSGIDSVSAAYWENIESRLKARDRESFRMMLQSRSAFLRTVK